MPADAERNLTELCDIDPAVFLVIKRKILAWVEDNLERIKPTRPERPDWLKPATGIYGGCCSRLPPSLEVPHLPGSGPLQACPRTVWLSNPLAIEILSCIREMAKEPAFIVMVERGGKDEVFLPSQTIVDFCNAQEEHHGRTGRQATRWV